MSATAAPAIRFESVSKVYKVYARPRDRLVEAVTGRPRHSLVQALHDVSGTVPAGAVLGIVGENGAGKSTLLKILAGTAAPTSGRVEIPGRVASILELGSSFHPEFTGRRNVVLQAALTGLTESQAEEAIPEIEAFAELGPFFDRAVKTYSSGMQMRLAFAVATAVLPDVVILDEALSVGDGHFQKKCVDRIHDLKASGRTILFCSHAMYYVSTLCDEAIWLNAGKVAGRGSAQEVVLAYEEYLARREQVRPAAAPPPGIAPDTHGKIARVALLDGDGEERTSFRPGEPWTVDLELLVDDPSRPVQVHLAVSTRDNVVCFSADSRLDRTGPFCGSSRHRLRVTVDALPLAKGEFVLHAYLADENALALYDARSDLSFHVESPTWRSGLMSVPSRWERL